MVSLGPRVREPVVVLVRLYKITGRTIAGTPALASVSVTLSALVSHL